MGTLCKQKSSHNEMHIFHKEEACVETLFRKLRKNSQHCSITLQTPFDDHYKINGRQKGEAEVLQAHFEQVAKWAGNWQGKKRKTKKYPPTWECCGVCVKEMYCSLRSFCQGYCMKSNRSRNAVVIIQLNLAL